MAYYKSHSNFVLKSKHKITNGGTIYERDYTTIGGIDNFAPNQTPIYRSGNFLITINNETPQVKSKSKKDWFENNDGEIWTIKDVQNASANTEYNDNQIVIKNDYYSLKDFAYYGSCSELVRSSLNNILRTFPGELYITNNSIVYQDMAENQHSTIQPDDAIEEITLIENNDENTSSWSEILTSKSNYVHVENPFNIDIYTTWVNENKVKDKLKYLSANEWWQNYEIIDNEENVTDINKIEVINGAPFQDLEEAHIICSGYTVIFNDTLKIYVAFQNGQPIYYADNNATVIGTHIRPKQIFLDNFYKNLDNFESIILNPYTEPKYKATFEILRETDYGYTKSLEDFIFPVGEGGYNIASNTNLYDTYLSKFLDVTDYYDEFFTDNLYRMMTHDSIKNLDWSYDIPNPNAEEYEEGGSKITSMLRLFGREFDNIKFYINGITNVNNITYSDRSNLPDYFLTDSLEIDGWDVRNIYPYTLNEYLKKDNVNYYRQIENKQFINSFISLDKQDFGTINQVIETNNKADDNILYRIFTQDIVSSIKPYDTNNLDFPFGYFNVCDSTTTSECGKSYTSVSASSNDETTRIDGISQKVLRKKNKKFSSDKEYCYKDINTIFMKRLRLNSRDILKKKGTINGIESLLGIFGLKSKQFIEKYQGENLGKFYTEGNYDYSIKEYTSFVNGIDDPYWDCKEMNRLDWYNSTKSIQYDTQDYSDGTYIPYQGLPIIYRDIEGNKRRLYPFFDSKSIIDGNPYYQMKGGWQEHLTMMFDNYNNIVTPQPLNHKHLYKETIDCVKIVEKPKDLNEISIFDLKDGDVYKINDLDGKYLIIDGYLYPIYTDFKKYEYINVTKYNDVLQIGNTIFAENIFVSNPYGECDSTSTEPIRSYNIPSELSNGQTIKIYLTTDNNIIAKDNIVTEDIINQVLETNQFYVKDGIFTESLTVETRTNYFKLSNHLNKNIFNLNDNNGWKQLSITDLDYLQLNTLENYFKGNNPHTGNLAYDGGFDYMNYFANLFNYSYNHDLFDIRPYRGTFDWESQYIGAVGFKNLIEEECDKKYVLYEDSKVHYFGDWFTNTATTTNYFNVEDITSWYDYKDYEQCKQDFDTLIATDKKQTIIDDNNKEVCIDSNVDGSQYQILNTKVVLISFNLHSSDNEKDNLEEIKFLQSIVIPYMEQVLPSSIILKIEYITKEQPITSTEYIVETNLNTKID